MSGEVSIKVAIRCRPYTIDDQLGVKMWQTQEESGEVELINCNYATKRFPFTYSWWSAYGWKRHFKGSDADRNAAEAMTLVDQLTVYQGCGSKVMADLLDGNAVVLFAYGLSGSGKTFTVFGPDAVDAPEAWFKHAEPTNMWGLFPRLAYDIFKEREKNPTKMKVSMKYFQNVVDIVRDLMSSDAEEKHYKNGMRKDPDGFMDIEWCDSKVLESWDDLRKTFQVCNARKAIAPTQFNPMSTRGHCIMVLEIEMIQDDDSKKRGRLYVCDLAGTEPAGDIFYAKYEKVNFQDEDGNDSFEYKLIGPHEDKKKTEELQDQGKKINLSLSEMAQFFMKMAGAVKAKKLKPGMSIPGCNSYFLCKYLKDTMLQARTYLFCAIRPEATYLKYTFATLGFATNASVVKLSPKKVQVAGSAKERELQAQLDAMKAEMEALKKKSTGGSGSNAADAQLIADLQAKLAAGGNSGFDAEAEKIKQYAERGIYMTAHEEANTFPYFHNLDEDEFRSKVFMYILKKEVTVFGSKGDIHPMSLSVVRDHATVSTAGGKITVTAGKGDVWVNGSRVKQGETKELKVMDRIAMGDLLMVLRVPGGEEGAPECMSGEDAVSEFQEGLQRERNSGGGSADAEALAAERAKIQAEREAWEKDKSAAGEKAKTAREQEEHKRQMAVIDNSILDLLPKTKEAKQTVDLFNRITMSFDVILEKGADQIPKVKISIENSSPKLSILLEPQDFLKKLSLLKDEHMKIKNAIDGGRDYELPEQHDPLFLFFDNDFHLGTATHWPEYLLYNLITDDEEKDQEVKNAAVPYNNIGLLGVTWTPLAGPNESDWEKEPLDIEDESELLGKSWTYRLNIDKAENLPVLCNVTYVQYEFFGELFTTEAVQQTTYSPSFGYSCIHHIPNVTQEFIDYLKGPFEMQIHVTQHVDNPADKISTENNIVVESLRTGDPKGYEHADAKRPKSEAEIQCQKLQVALARANEEIASLKKQLEELKDHHEPELVGPKKLLKTSASLYKMDD